jgi:tetratricopeptide (TPR) repeat protein
MPDKNSVCLDTHRLISSGVCPACKTPVIDGIAKPGISQRDVAATRWNVPAMVAALRHPFEESPCFAAIMLLMRERQPETILPALRAALENPDANVRWGALTALETRGRDMTADVGDRLERQLENNPEDFVVRIILLNYCWWLRERTPFREKHQQHAIWLIENRPELAAMIGPEIELDPAANDSVYDQAKQIWLRHIEARQNDAAFLGETAQHFFLNDPKLAEELLKKAQTLEPENPEWRERLGFLYELKSYKQTSNAILALSELEQSLRLTNDPSSRVALLVRLAKAAFSAGEFEKARTYAVESLEKSAELNASEADAIHNGNLILGRLALREGMIEKAKEHLLQSLKTSGAPVQRSFGPNMALAKELLDKGERATVIEYLKLCSNFWQTPNHQAEQWIHAIEQGAMPDFGKNLTY